MRGTCTHITLEYNQLCYFGALKEDDIKRLNKVVEKAQCIVGQDIQSLSTVYDGMSVKKAQSIMDDESHPLHQTIVERKSTRVPGRFLSIKCHSKRFANTFIPSVIRSLNKNHERN